jgi:hypothetical protein
MNIHFGLLGWHIRIVAIRKGDYMATFREIMMDAMIYGRGFARVEPDAIIEFPNPLVK